MLRTGREGEGERGKGEELDVPCPSEPLSRPETRRRELPFGRASKELVFEEGVGFAWLEHELETEEVAVRPFAARRLARHCFNREDARRGQYL